MIIVKAILICCNEARKIFSVSEMYQQEYFSVNDAFLNIYLIDSLQGKTWTVVSDDEGGYNVTLPLGFGMYG